MSRYVSICPLGRGMAGTVIKAVDMQDGEVVALKCSSFVDAIRTEAAVLSFAKHPNIVRVKAAFPSKTGESATLVMECMQGCLNGKHITHQGTLKIIMYQLLLALDYLHRELRVIHMDVKPANLLINDLDDPQRTTMKLCDFNLAKSFFSPSAADQLLPIKASAGTVGYIAPEMLLGQAVGPAIDIWAAGSTLVELLTNKPLIPFTAPLNQHLDIIRDLQLHSMMPAGNELLFDLCSKLLAFDPSTRITAADALRHPFFSVSHHPKALPSPWMTACRIACRRVVPVKHYD